MADMGSQEEQDKGRLEQPKDGIPESTNAEKYELPQGYLEYVTCRPKHSRARVLTVT